MKSGLGCGVLRAPGSPFLRQCGTAALAVALAGALAGCTNDGRPSVAGMQPRGATVAFESIDGPPQGQFNTLVRNLNDEAQQRRLAVLSRDATSAYRVRGYLAAKVAKRPHDDFLGLGCVRSRRAARHSHQRRGSRQTIRQGCRRRLACRRRGHAAPDRQQQHGAARGLPDLGDAVPVAAAPAVTPVALIGPADTSPEAAGIFRTFQADADPAPIATCGQAAGSPAPAAPAGRPGGDGPGQPLKARFVAAALKRRGTTNSSHIAAPPAPCYDPAPVHEGVGMAGKNGAIKLVAGNSNPALAAADRRLSQDPADQSRGAALRRHGDLRRDPGKRARRGRVRHPVDLVSRPTTI